MSIMLAFSGKNKTIEVFLFCLLVFIAIVSSFNTQELRKSFHAHTYQFDKPNRLDTAKQTIISRSKHSSHFHGCSLHALSMSSINKQSNGRRKMGPPSRKQYSTDSSQELVGRVTVYCVGGGLDLQALRAHVFRRGFSGSFINESKNDLAALPIATGADGITDLSNLMLSRSITSEKDVDDEVLHVTNSPLLMNLNSMSEKLSDNSNGLSDSEDMDEDDDKELIRKNMMLLRATQDIFYFDYGCVVFWGLSPQEERAALSELQQFTIESTSADELKNSFDTMEYVYDRKANPQRPIRFDRMKVRTLNVEEKLSLSYGMAQSSKLFVLESRVLQSIEMTRYLPKDLSTDGKIKLSKKEINRLIGKLFVEQTEVNLFSSILDTPDFLWDNDEHLPTYEYIRSYLEVDDRVALLNSRLSVIRELLDVLNAQVAHNNSERLEWIVIWLISVEIVLGIFSNPLFAGKKFVSALLVPTAILLFKRAN